METRLIALAIARKFGEHERMRKVPDGYTTLVLLAEAVKAVMDVCGIAQPSRNAIWSEAMTTFFATIAGEI